MLSSGRRKRPFAGLSTADRQLGHCGIVSPQLATVDPSGFLAGKPGNVVQMVISSEGEGLSSPKKVQSLETRNTEIDQKD